MATKGVKLSKQHKVNIGKSHKGKHYPKLSRAKEGHSVSDATKIKISETKKKNPTRYWLGKKFSNKMKKKMSEAKQGEKSTNWKGGISYDKKTYFLKRREAIAGRKKPEQCEICGAFGKICLDHNHKTDKFRGWICHRCNVVLGFVKDNRELLNMLIDYLSKNQ